jgi:transposase-like protein
VSEQPRFASSKRKRVYTRKFDYEEARRRWQGGATITALAREYGVSFDTVRRGIKLATRDAERGIRQLAPGEVPSVALPARNRCPLCEGRKSPYAELCYACYQAGKLLPLRVERIPGVERAVLADVALGSVVKRGDRWAVVERGGPGNRVLHYWDGPAELVPHTEIVVIAPSLRVMAGDVEQESELVA